MEEEQQLSQAAQEAAARKLLKKRLRQRCFELRLNADTLFDNADGTQSSKDLIPLSLFYKTLESHQLRLDDHEKTLIHFFCSPSGLLSLRSFFQYLDIQRPQDYIDPDLVFPQLPQPFRMIAKVLDDEIIDHAWFQITSTTKFKLEQGQLNADLEEKEAKERLCRPSSIISLPHTTPSTNVSYVISNDSESILFVHVDISIEIKNGQGKETLIERQQVFPSQMKIRCLSQLNSIRIGQSKCTFFAISGEKTPLSDDSTEVPDSQLNGIQTLVYVYALEGSKLEHRMTLPSKDQLSALYLADDAAYLAAQWENGNIDVYHTQVLTTGIPSTPSPLPFDGSKISLHVDPLEFDLCPKLAEPTPPPVASNNKAQEKINKGKAKEISSDENSSQTTAPVVYSSYLFISFQSQTDQNGTTSTHAITLASKHKMLQYLLAPPQPPTPPVDPKSKDDPPPPVMSQQIPISTVTLASHINCVAMDSTSTLIALGLVNGSVFVWNSRFNIEYAGLGCHNSSVRSLCFYKCETLVSISDLNEVYFSSLQDRHDMLPPSLLENTSSFIRVFDGQTNGCYYTTVLGLHDAPLCFLFQTDKEVVVYDSRTAQVVASLSEIPDSTCAASCHVIGDQLYLPSINPETNSFQLSIFTAPSILQSCTPLKIPYQIRSTSFKTMEKLSAPTKPSIPASSQQGRPYRPSSTGSTSDLKSLVPSSGLIPCNINAFPPSQLKTVFTISKTTTLYQMTNSNERDSRMNKRRGEILKTIHSIW